MLIRSYLQALLSDFNFVRFFSYFQRNFISIICEFGAIICAVLGFDFAIEFVWGQRSQISCELV